MREILLQNQHHEEVVFKQPIISKHPSNNLAILFEKVRYSNGKIFSVELCPNIDLKTKALEKLSPAFCSVTWHSQSDAILEDISNIPAISLSKQLSLLGNHVLIHLVGRHLNKSQAVSILDELQRIHVRNIFVLQGDPSLENKDKSDFHYASDLVKFIRLNYGSYFFIGVAAYPNTPGSKDKVEELKYLKMKVDMGADFIITQMFFDSKTFTNFYMECRKIGINVPIIPGVYIINSYISSTSMAAFCKVQIPKDIMQVLSANEKNPESICNYGVFQCSQLVKEIFLKNVIGVHFFSLNNIKLVRRVCKILGLCDVYIERPISTIQG